MADLFGLLIVIISFKARETWLYSTMAIEKQDRDATHDEVIGSPKGRPSHDASLAKQVGFDIEGGDVPKGYYTSKFFIGTYLAIGLGIWAGTAAL